MKAIVIGKEIKKYTKDGQEKTSRTLYVISQPKNQPDGLEGLKSEAIFVPFDIPAGVDPGVQCDFEYEVFQTKSGSAARLLDITPIQKMRFIIEPDVKH